MRVIQKAMEFRKAELEKYEDCGCQRLGNVTTVNLTMLQAGVQYNVVPAVAMAGVTPN